MAERRVRVSLTIEQAENLAHAAGQALDFKDIAESVFGDRRDRDIAYRALATLWRSIAKARAGDGLSGT